MNTEVRIAEKYALSISEAAKLFNIGEKKLAELFNDNITEQWALTVGNRKRLIKRQLFAEWLDGVNSL